MAGLLALVRWPNLLLALAGVIVGAEWAARGTPVPILVAWGGTAACALGVVAYAWNALQDRAIDARGRPERPIPSGAVTPRAAAWLVAATCVVALGASARISGGLAAATAVAIVLLLGYGPLKARWGIGANVLAATLGSAPFLYGAWAAGAPGRALPLMAAAIPVHFAREIAKDIADAAADAPDRRTLPLAVGLGRARQVVVVATASAIAGFAALVAHRPMTAWGLVPAALVCAYGAWRVVRGRVDGAGWLKAGMATALVGLLAGGAGPA